MFDLHPTHFTAVRPRGAEKHNPPVTNGDKQKEGKHERLTKNNNY